MRRFTPVGTAKRSAAGLCAALVLAGCGAAPAPTPAPATDPPAATAAAGSAAENSPAAPSAGNDAEAKTKWVGEIPYDVFYDQPLVVAADNARAVPSISTSVAAEPPTGMTPPADTPAATAAPGSSTPQPAATAEVAGLDWQQLVQAEVLNEAVTQIRNRLTTHLNTLATYNRNIDAIANDGACLAALAAVAEVHPDAVNWKDKAKYVRDLGYEIYQKADGSGREAYDATKLPFEQIVAILNGGPPPDITAEDAVPFVDVADRTQMMQRIKRSFDFLRTEINTESRFQELPEEIVREASVLASFGGVISSEGYDSADQPMYQQFVREFMQANVDVVKAARADDFTGFQTARDQIQQACDRCHGEYAFGSDSF